MVAVQPWLQPTATLTAALLVLISAGLTIRQRHRADSKDQWWKRTQGATELTLRSHDTQAREAGLLVMDQQASSRFADAEDSALIRTLSSALLADLRGTAENGQWEEGRRG